MSASFYTLGGSVEATSAAYVKRAADDELFEKIRAGELCYVLTTRQMGKSSMMNFTARRLHELGDWIPVSIDVSSKGGEGNVTAEQWYYSICEDIADQVEIEINFGDWWDQQHRLPVSERLLRFFRDVLLKQTAKQIVIFVDEIDSTLNLSFSDDFFATIRACFNARSANPDFKRLTFVLLGVASPADLMQDRTRTPFNVGSRVELTDFTFAEARALAVGLSDDPELGKSLLQAVLNWSDGHPYLTHMLCAACQATQAKTPEDVDRVVNDQLLAKGKAEKEKNLSFVRERLAAKSLNPMFRGRLLKTYQRVLKGRHVVDEPQSPVHLELKLSGVVKPTTAGAFVVRNKIYRNVFGPQWLSEVMPVDWGRRVAIAAVFLLMAAVGSEYGYRRPEVYATQLAEASDDVELARKNYVALQSYPFYGNRAVTLWGEFQERRFQLAVENDARAIESGVQGLKGSLMSAESARKELEDCPGAKWKSRATELWQDFQKQRLLAAIKLDEASWVAFDNLSKGAENDGKNVPDQDSSKAEKLRLQEAQCNAYELAQQAHAAFKQPEAMAQFYDRRAERAEAHEHLEGGVLWRLASLKEVDTPKNRRAVTHLIGPDYAPLVRTWGLSVPDSEGVFVCKVFKNETRLLIGAGNELKVCDFESGDVLETFRHDADINGAKLSADESRVLTWATDGAARVWEFGNSKPFATIRHPELKPDDAPSPPLDFKQAGKGNDRQPPPRITRAEFGTSGRRIVTIGDDTTACVWDVTKPEPLQTFKHDSVVRGALFSRDESRVLTWSGDRLGNKGEARLWDVTKPEPLQTFKHDSVVRGALFNRDESRVLTWSEDYTARLWDMTKPEPLQTLKHAHSVNGALFSRDESRVLTWSDDQTARLWEVTKPEPLQTFKHDSYVNGALFSRDESRVLTWSYDQTARLWDVTKSGPLQTFKHNRPVYGVMLSRDESRVLTWSYDKTARLWDVTKPEPLQTFKHDSDVNGALFSRDESRVLTWSYDKTARLWGVTKPEPLQTFKHDSDVNGALFSRDESRVLTWSGDRLGSKGEARLWDVTKPEPLRNFKHNRMVYGASFSRDESRVLTWSDDHTARLWEVTKPEPLQTFKHDSVVLGALFSRDESRVLTWSYYNPALLWDVTKPEPLQTFKHSSGVNGALFSRDGSRVLTWSKQFGSNSEARLWDVTKSEPLQTFKIGDAVWKAEFTGDESALLALSTNWLHQLPLAKGTVRLSRREAGQILNQPKWNAKPQRFSIARNWPGGGAFSMQSLSWDDYDESPIKGEPGLLLKEWQDKFGQEVNTVGDVVPMRPLPVRRLLAPLPPVLRSTGYGLRQPAGGSPFPRT